MPGVLEMAVVRSAVAHARLLAVGKPEGLVFCAEDLQGVSCLVPDNTPPGARTAPFPYLARDKLRFVGEPVAVALASTRALAEDLAERVEVETEVLPAVIDIGRARASADVRVHEEWPDNIVQELALDCGGDAARAACEAAPVRVMRTFTTARQSMNPMEGKACLAVWDARVQELVLYSSTQVPHMVRDAVAEALGMRQSQLRVIAPDVGGGFGYKCILQAEEVLVAWLAMRLQRPVRWVEDRREHLVAAANAREQQFTVTAFADSRGVLLGLEADITVDAGAWSVVPFTNMLDAGMALGNMTGPYRIPCYRGRSRAVVTNKPPVAPYRGVARPGACFAIEQLLDAVAREVGREPWAVRLDNLVPAADMPWLSVTGKTYDSGDYPQALTRALAMIDVEAVRRAQQQPQTTGKRLGVGVAFFVELTGHSPKAAHDWRLPVRAASEPATVALTGDGTIEVRIGLQSHGQSMETTMAQVVCEVLGVAIEDVTVLHGDTGRSGYSSGTYASRGMVAGAGAIAGASRLLAGRLARLGARMMQCAADEVRVAGGRVHGPGHQLSFGEIARRYHVDYGSFAGVLGPEEDSLEATYGYAMSAGSGAYTYGAHAALVEVDIRSGSTKLLDYVVVEDCGTPVNPMVVDGQIIGGVVQGIGTALYEESCFDAVGQPVGATLADYLLPGASDVPFIRIDHMVSPSPWTEFGVKGVGEGGAIPSGSVVCSAVNDALREWGVVLTGTPLTPRKVLGELLKAQR
ncbi:MAG: xanthine dehydrogenase family protein molybdopterin-binding subunit [Lautropia sp.]